MCGATFAETPTMHPRLLPWSQVVDRRHWSLRVQHWAAICGCRIRVLAPATSVTERTLSIPGSRQKVITPSSPPSITWTPPAGMLVSIEPGGGGAVVKGDGRGGDGDGGGGGGETSHVRIPPAVHTLP